MISFQVMTEPVAQPRQNYRVLKNKAGKLFCQSYVPSKHPVHNYKKLIAEAAQLYQGVMPTDKTYQAVLTFVINRPKQFMKKKSPDGRLYHNRTPDGDNLAKSTLDAMTGILYDDDSQIAVTTIRKMYAAKHELPSVTVHLQLLD